MKETQTTLGSSEVAATSSPTVEASSLAGDETGVDQVRLARLLEEYLEACESVDALEAELGRVTRALQGARGLAAIAAREIRAEIAKLRGRGR